MRCRGFGAPRACGPVRGTEKLGETWVPQTGRGDEATDGLWEGDGG